MDVLPAFVETGTRRLSLRDYLRQLHRPALRGGSTTGKGVEMDHNTDAILGGGSVPRNGGQPPVSAGEFPPPEELARLVRQALGGGAPLDAPVRSLLEGSLGADLAQVRVHADERADHLAAALGADAFTAGADIFFRKGAYNTGIESGLRLLAHEAAHTVQQAGARAGGRPPLAVRLSSPGDDAERAAERAAGRVIQGFQADSQRPRVSVHRLHSGEPVVIQRHASWEHRLLGDAPPADLNTIAQQPGMERTRLLTDLRDFLHMWSKNPQRVTEAQINARYPDIRTVRLKASKLLVTYGELNTLPDYLANSTEMDALPELILLPILQAVRQEGYYNAGSLLKIEEPVVKFDGAVAAHLSNGTINDIWESIWLNSLTADLPPAGSARFGTNSYSGLLARNACHFAPYSWYRWAQSYDMALKSAGNFHKTGDPAAEREAWAQLGYADHFLQDSFAAGHLINKTLVMQWFIDWAAPRALTKVPDWEQVKTMTAARQPGLAARGLYTRANPGGVRDPQTTEEQASRSARMAMSGVLADGPIIRDAAYQNYLTFLDSAVVQSSPLALHDDLNKTGLLVASEDQATPFLVYGDGTMLNGGDGVRIAGETSHMSQQSIQDVLRTGTSAITRDRIWRRFPTRAGADAGSMLPLQQWHENQKNRANAAFEKVHDVIIGTLNPHMGHVSMDQVGTFRIKLSYAGKQKYLGNDGEYARLVDRKDATVLKMRFENGIFYGTGDDWWLSVGTVGVRNGYCRFYFWKNAGNATWEYDAATKRLKSGVNGAVMSFNGDDGYVYCWSGYPAIDVELEDA
ncbi:MAG: DUF4157 domain-containing protein [Dehalococcoidia bacterium]